jgi:hypothetical protein
MGNCCCFCCLDEGAKVGRVLEKFNAIPARQAQLGALNKVVGRVVLAGQNPFYAPGSGRPCVYYKVKVEQEFEDIREDQDGRITRSFRWQTIATDEQFVDFYLQDGISKIFVRGSDRAHCKIQGNRDHGGTSGMWSVPPPGIRALIGFRNPNYRWHNSGFDLEFATGRYRYSEAAFEVNKLVAGLGVIQPAVDPMGNSIMMLVPFAEDTLNEEYFKQNNWSDFDKRSWKDLLMNPSVLLSDKPHFTSGVQVNPVQFPRQMYYQVAVAVPEHNWSQQYQQPQAYAYAVQPQPYDMNRNGGRMGGGYGAITQPLL